jgi:G3E family GTPase
LLDLSHRAGDRFDRVLIETSGLADPAPILHALMTDPVVYATHVIDTMLTVVDPVHGEATLARFPEARRQVALADGLVFSKTDIATPGDSLRLRVFDLNPGTPPSNAIDIRPEALFMGSDPMARAARFAALPDHPVASPFTAASHAAAIETLSLRRQAPLPALALTLWLEALAEHCGDRLLRMKGLVAIEEMPGRPAMVHGVRHVFSPPEFLEQWPSEDESTRLVFIFQGMPRHFPSRLLDAIEEEVKDELTG